MDNLTHSLVGALIGQAGLKRKTGLAMQALILGANIPDIDGACMLLGDMQHLALRRGLTHGPLAWFLLPLALAAGLWAVDRWQGRRGKRPERRLPVRFGWLYALAFIACLSHPALDWLNNYGIRFLAPFSQRWFYGDVLFIIDLWLWLGLGFATWLSLRREKATGGDGGGPARLALGGALLYIGVNAAITWQAERRALAAAPYPAVAIASEVPVLFWRREIITGNGDGIWRVGGRAVGDVPLARCDLALIRAQDRAAAAFLFWSRAPFVERLRDGRWRLGDARFASRGGDRFSVMLPAPACRSG